VYYYAYISVASSSASIRSACSSGSSSEGLPRGSGAKPCAGCAAGNRRDSHSSCSQHAASAHSCTSAAAAALGAAPARSGQLEAAAQRIVGGTAPTA
jgi:hypothetical protein